MNKIDRRDNESVKPLRRLHLKRKGRLGVRQMKLELEREGIVINKKKISRLKKKYGLLTKIRVKKNKVFYKKRQEHKTMENVLAQDFKAQSVGEKFSTDITYLPYGGSKTAYLSAIKDLKSKEIVAYKVSGQINTELTNSCLREFIEKNKDKGDMLIHSDQGFHYTHKSYRTILENEEITQSMSRKGNCLDNAPIESFFGLLKDHLDLSSCREWKDVRKEVREAIRYYNEERPQLGLNKKTPAEYRSLLAS